MAVAIYSQGGQERADPKGPALTTMIKPFHSSAVLLTPDIPRHSLPSSPVWPLEGLSSPVLPSYLHRSPNNLMSGCGYLHIHAPSNISHTSQEVEATQPSIDGWMNKQNVICTYSGIFFLKKERNSQQFYNMNEIWGHYVNEISQLQKDKYSMILLIWSP
jgi:hypothetical protein